jgi:hypothetical protein
MKRKTPQEKKAESYAKDRRNTYGENAKSSRRNIARNQRLRNRAYRRIARQAFGSAATDDERVDAAEARVKLKHRKGWRKVPDTPLGEVVRKKLTRREALERPPETDAGPPPPARDPR